MQKTFKTSTLFIDIYYQHNKENSSKKQHKLEKHKRQNNSNRKLQS